MDLRPHRIGQTKPLLIFWLVRQDHAACIREEALVIAKVTYLPVYDDQPPPLLRACVSAFAEKCKFKAPIGGGAKAPQTIAEMAAQLLELEGEHIEVVMSTAAGKCSVISDAELDVLLDRRKDVFECRGVGWKSCAAGKDGKGDGINARAGTARAGRGDADSGLFEVYEAPADEGNDALAHMLGGDLAA
ncbi:hypothetical protein BJV74DRAFT_798291 [Russula compacta]|nr:hypothetical protein BJV74DRAFT_798291 [Russula compacta]